MAKRQSSDPSSNSAFSTETEGKAAIRRLKAAKRKIIDQTGQAAEDLQASLERHAPFPAHD